MFEIQELRSLPLFLAKVLKQTFISFLDILQVPTKENACKTVNDQPIVKGKKFQREMFQNASKTVDNNAPATEKRKSMKVSSNSMSCVVTYYS